MDGIHSIHTDHIKNIAIVLLVFLVVFWYEAANGHAFSLLFSSNQSTLTTPTSSNVPVKVVTEESLTVSTVKQAGPSVVTVAGISSTPQDNYNYDPYSPYGNSQSDQSPQTIGSGFIIGSNGLIVTNKHVVSDTSASYQVITADDKKYTVKNIYRDPQNDVAILQITPSDNPGEKLQPLSFGDSSNLQPGQFVIAIGTALGQFRNTVTTGVISGLNRGITAGDIYQGQAENLTNVIQTSAAVNPGNSGGPLINDAGQVIGINTATDPTGQNIGFALPISVVQSAVTRFNLGL